VRKKKGDKQRREKKRKGSLNLSEEKGKKRAGGRRAEKKKGQVAAVPNCRKEGNSSEGEKKPRQGEVLLWGGGNVLPLSQRGGKKRKGLYPPIGEKKGEVLIHRRREKGVGENPYSLLKRKGGHISKAAKKKTRDIPIL